MMIDWTSPPTAALAIPALLFFSGCMAIPHDESLTIRGHENTCEVMIDGPQPIGAIRLWVPEGIMSNTGACAVYPFGDCWHWESGALTQRVSTAGLFGKGNFNRVAPDRLECAGIEIPIDEPVEWETNLAPSSTGITFRIRLRNAGDQTIRKAGAAICLKFLQGDWWSDDRVFVVSDGRIRSLGDLGWDAGRPNSFQAYLLTGHSFDNVFYHEFWGINRHRLDCPKMISEHPDQKTLVVIETDHAYFLHSNKGNPCTDVMLAFGDVRPGETVQAGGCVRILQSRATDLLKEHKH